MALSTVSDVQSAIGVDVSTTDETSITNIFIPAADAAIKNYVGYELEYSASITDTFDGNHAEELFTSVAPIVAITSLTEDAVALTEGNQEDYVAYKNLGRLRKVNNKRWSDIRYQNISVTYSGGYSDSESSAEDIPKDIKLGEDGGLYVDKTFPPGDTLITVGFKVPSISGVADISVKPVFAIPAFSYFVAKDSLKVCLLYTSPSPRDRTRSRMPSSA